MGCSASRELDVVVDTESNRRPGTNRLESNDARQRDGTVLAIEPWMAPNRFDSTMLQRRAEMRVQEGIRDHRQFAFRRRRGHGSSLASTDNVGLHDVLALQQSLEAMELFFQTLLGQNFLYMEAMDPNPSGCGPPPASEPVMAALKRTAVQKNELHSHNRHCVICCEPYTVGEIVTRLPCSHFFHPHCVEPWLHRHCTCPTCRYELATDDGDYEHGRIERMKVRQQGVGSTPPSLPRNLTACSTEDESDYCPSDEDDASLVSWEGCSHWDDLPRIGDARLGGSRSRLNSDEEKEEISAKEDVSRGNVEVGWASFNQVSTACTNQSDRDARNSSLSISLGDCCTNTTEDRAPDGSVETTEMLRADGSLTIPDATHLSD